MRMNAGPVLLMSILSLAAGGCVASETDESLRILRSDGDGVVLHGLIDATRTAPLPRYDALAAQECARVGKSAAFVSMVQKSTFGFDVTYRCEIPPRSS
jgi:hypothetical protein